MSSEKWRRIIDCEVLRWPCDGWGKKIIPGLGYYYSIVRIPVQPPLLQEPWATTEIHIINTSWVLKWLTVVPVLLLLAGHKLTSSTLLTLKSFYSLKTAAAIVLRTKTLKCDQTYPYFWPPKASNQVYLTLVFPSFLQSKNISIVL